VHRQGNRCYVWTVDDPADVELALSLGVEGIIREMRHRGDVVHITAATRGTPLEDGGYLWQGQLRVWDNEVVMGWYVADEGAVRSKGTMYFVLHQHGIRLVGRWVGLSYDGPIISG